MTPASDLISQIRNGEHDAFYVLADYWQEHGDPRGELIVRDLKGKTSDGGYKKLTMANEKNFRAKFADYEQNLSLQPEWHCGFLKALAITNPTEKLLDELVHEYGTLLQNLRVSFTDDMSGSLSDVLEHPIMKTIYFLTISEEFRDISVGGPLQKEIDAPQLRKVRMDYLKPQILQDYCLWNMLLPLGTIEEFEFYNYHETEHIRNRPFPPLCDILYSAHGYGRRVKKLTFNNCGLRNWDLQIMIDVPFTLTNLQSLDLSSNEHLSPEHLEDLLRHAPTALPALREIKWYGNIFFPDFQIQPDWIRRLRQNYNCEPHNSLNSHDLSIPENKILIHYGPVQTISSSLWEITPLDDDFELL